MVREREREGEGEREREREGGREREREGGREGEREREREGEVNTAITQGNLPSPYSCLAKLPWWLSW